MAEILLGKGKLGWPRFERVSDRYGTVNLVGPEPDLSNQDYEEQAAGQRGSLRARVLEARESPHIGDLFHGIFPSKPEIGEEIKLGEGTLFFETQEDSTGSWRAVGLQPDDGRDSWWLDPHGLYRANAQTVELIFQPEKKSRKKGAAGQILPIIAFGLVALLVGAGLVLDGGVLMMNWWLAQEDLDAAVCGIAAGVPVQTEAQITIGERDVRGVLTDQSPAFLLQLVGFDGFEYMVRSRCLRPRARFTPIAVKEPWLDGSPWPILGAEHPGEQQCDDCQGADFVGAVLPWIECTGTNCDPKTFWPPTTESNSPNVFKDLFRENILGQITSPIPEIGTRIPQISGVSNQFVVKAFADAGYEIGDEIVVIVFNGQIAQPDPGYGAWENVAIIYYAIFKIEDMDANTLTASFVEQIPDLAGVRSVTRVQAIPWEWEG